MISQISHRKQTMNSYVYIMTNTHNSVLYVGITSDLKSRVVEHKWGVNKNSFTDIYKCTKLVYFEEYRDIKTAIAREKKLKRWKREWKVQLIEEKNPMWEDLFKT